MAILIPSKNIYDISDNNKVLDNLIQSVTIDGQKVVPQNDYDVRVHTISQDAPTLVSETQKDEDYSQKRIGLGGSGDVIYYRYAVAYASFDQKKTYSGTAYIPVVGKNKYISALKLGKNDDGENNIHLALYGRVENGIASGNWQLDAQNIVLTIGAINRTPSETTDVISYKIPQEITSEHSTNTGINDVSVSYTQKLTDPFTNLGEITSATKETIDGVEYFVISYTVLCGATATTMHGDIPNFSTGYMPTSVSLTGTYEKYTPTRIELTFYGNTIGIELDQNTYVIGSGEHNFGINGNELMHSSQNNTSLSTYLTTHWGKGKETAVIKCSIGEYYNDMGDLCISAKTQKPLISKDDVDVDGDFETYIVFVPSRGVGYPYDIIIEYSVTLGGLSQLRTALLPKNSLSVTVTLSSEGNAGYVEEYGGIISVSTPFNYALPMTFSVGDRVVPHIMSAQGSDAPMSQDQYGSAKAFEVVGTNIYYDGAVGQKLTLQEV